MSKYEHHIQKGDTKTIPLSELEAVTDDEIDLWLLVVAKMGPHVRFSLRNYHVKWNNIRFKVARAKKEGDPLFAIRHPVPLVLSVLSDLALAGYV